MVCVLCLSLLSTSVNLEGKTRITTNYTVGGGWLSVIRVGELPAPELPTIANIGNFLGREVVLTGFYRGWESGHGSPLATRSDWVLQDATGFIYVTGKSCGLRYPQDAGKPVIIKGIVKVKNGCYYIQSS